MAAPANAATIPEEIATLQAQVAALQSQVNTQNAHITTLQSQLTTQQNQLTVARPVLALAPFVSVDPNPEINVTGPSFGSGRAARTRRDHLSSIPNDAFSAGHSSGEKRGQLPSSECAQVKVLIFLLASGSYSEGSGRFLR